MNIGCTFLIIRKIPSPKSGIIQRKMREISLLILNEAIIAKIIIPGARTASFTSIWYELSTFVTSVVSRVIIEEGENLSMLENEKFCTLAYISCRKFDAKPADAFAAVTDENTPVSN